MESIKLDNDIIYIRSCSIQLSIGSHASIYIITDNNKKYYDTFFEKYDNRESFTIYGKKFVAEGTFIKLISITKNYIDVSFRCDVLNEIKTEERRDVIISEILDIKNNI